MTSTVVSGSRNAFNAGSTNGVHIRLNISSYATGGEDVSPSVLGLETTAVPRMVAAVPANATTPVSFTHDRANNKVLAYVPNTGAEKAATTNIGEVEMTFLQG